MIAPDQAGDETRTRAVTQSGRRVWTHQEKALIDWINLIGNSLWILGCAFALAAFSHASWAASRQNEKFLSRLYRPVYQTTLKLAAILYGAGMAISAASKVEMALWLLWVAGFSLYALYPLFVRKEGN